MDFINKGHIMLDQCFPLKKDSVTWEVWLIWHWVFSVVDGTWNSFIYNVCCTTHEMLWYYKKLLFYEFIVIHVKVIENLNHDIINVCWMIVKKLAQCNVNIACNFSAYLLSNESLLMSDCLRNLKNPKVSFL